MHECHLLHFLLLVHRKELFQKLCFPVKPQILAMDMATKLVLQAAGFLLCNAFLLPSDLHINFLVSSSLVPCLEYYALFWFMIVFRQKLIGYINVFSYKYGEEESNDTSVEAANVSCTWIALFLLWGASLHIIFSLRWLNTHWLILKPRSLSLVPALYIDVAILSRNNHVFMIICNINDMGSVPPPCPLLLWRLSTAFVYLIHWVACVILLLFLLDQSLDIWQEWF